jgi:hypothetical protein
MDESIPSTHVLGASLYSNRKQDARMQRRQNRAYRRSLSKIPSYGMSEEAPGGKAKIKEYMKLATSSSRRTLSGGKKAARKKGEKDLLIASAVVDEVPMKSAAMKSDKVKVVESDRDTIGTGRLATS